VTAGDFLFLGDFVDRLVFDHCLMTNSRYTITTDTSQAAVKLQQSHKLPPHATVFTLIMYSLMSLAARI
jgi:hypothetical protein